MENYINHDIFHLLHQKSRYIKKHLNSKLTEHTLYASQWTILFCLGRFGPMTQTEISTYLNVEAPTITRTLVKMEENHWITRKPGSDKRERIIEMTEKANTTFTIVIKEVAEIETELLNDFTTDEKSQLYHLLTKINS